MPLRRSLTLLTAAPLLGGLAVAVPALAAAPRAPRVGAPRASAAPRVSVRVEAGARTLLAPRTVSAPGSGSYTKGGTPAGECPADTAAGALNVATHGRWNGTYSSGLGIEVTQILGTTAQYAHGSYWEFFVDDRAASTGICDTTLKTGESLLFAQVPARAKDPLPIVLSAPRHVRAGEPFTVRAFVYTGHGSATRGLDDVHYTTRGGGRVSVAAPMTSVSGTRRLTASRPGTLRITAARSGEIRSAPLTVTVTR